MSIASEIQRLQGAKDDIKTAIQAKGVTVPASAKLDTYDTYIAQIDGGGGVTPVASKDVDFLDYDGTVVYSYSAAEFAALSSLPANPSHTGLTAQGWNWSLVDAKAYVAKYGMLDIGQMYITDDGKTRLYISIRNLARPGVELHFYQSAANGVLVDWGDGSSPESVASSGTNKTLTHTYTAVDSYVITLKVQTGKARLGYNSSTSTFGSFSQSSRTYWKQTILTRVEFGENMGVHSCAFTHCSNLRSITMPEGFALSSYTNIFEYCDSLTCLVIPLGVTSIQSYMLYMSHCLDRIALPQSLTTIDTNAFYYCSALTRVTIPEGVTAIKSSSFSYDGALFQVILPESLTSLENSAFTYCRGIKAYYFYNPTPPTIGSNVFNNTASDRIIYVPAESVDAYKEATNWTTQTKYIQPIPES